MKGLLITNYYLQSEKFTLLADFFVSSFLEEGIQLIKKTNAEIKYDLNQNRDDFVKDNGDYDFILFYDKDIVLASHLEHLGFKVFNSSKAIENCDSKIKTYLSLAKNNLLFPKTVIVPKAFYPHKEADCLDHLLKDFSYPLIAKEEYGSFGGQVYLVDSLTKAKELMILKSPDQLIFQEFIESSKGVDLRVYVVNHQIVGAVKRTSKDDGFIANVTHGGVMEEYLLTKEEEKIAILASKALEIDFGGIDFLFGSNGLLVSEVNSNAHFLNFFKATKINFATCIAKYVKNDLTK